MGRGYFVTGTDTGVGKTLVSAALLYRLARQGLRCAGMKPVASGAWWDGARWRNEDVDMLCAQSSVKLDPVLVNPYLMRAATAPHIAAREEGQAIDLDHLLRCSEQIRSATDVMVVEGAGGFKIPLDETNDSDALATRLGLPVILVVGIRLGCINHALLTQQAIAACGLPLAGWIANLVAPTEPYAEAMVQSLRTRLRAPLLGKLPWMAEVDVATAAQRLDLSSV